MIPVVRDLLVVSTKGGRTSVATNFGTNEYLVCIQSDRTQVVWWACTSLDWSIVSSEFKKIEATERAPRLQEEADQRQLPHE